MKKLLVLPAILLVLAGMVLTGCPSDTDDDPEYGTPFTFAKKGTVKMDANSWDSGSNDQGQLSGTQTGAIRAGKTYKIKVTGTLEKSAVLKFVFVDNKDGDWKELTNYGQLDDTQKDSEGKPLAKVSSAGAINEEWKVTATLDAGGTAAVNNIVVLISNKDATENQDQGQGGNSITNAVVLIAEEGQAYPTAPDSAGFTWGTEGKPAGTEEAEINATKSQEWHTVDLTWQNTATIANGAKITYEFYIPKTATFPEGDEFQIQIADPDGDNGNWVNIVGAGTDGTKVQITDFSESGNYKKATKEVTTTHAGAGDLKIQISDAWVAYEGVVAIKLIIGQ